MIFSKELKNELETAVVDEPPVFELLKFYCIGENPSICLFLKYNEDEAPEEAESHFFQEWTDTRTFSYLEDTSAKILCKLKGNLYVTHVPEDKFYILFLSILAFYDWPLLGLKIHLLSLPL